MFCAALRYVKSTHFFVKSDISEKHDHAYVCVFFSLHVVGDEIALD
jgi:hypothetical protein